MLIMEVLEVIKFHYGCLIIFAIVLILAMLMVKFAYSQGKTNGYREGFSDGVINTGQRITDASYWFTRHPMITNTLYIMSRKLIKYKHFNAEDLRAKVYELGEQRYDNLSPDEIKALI